MSEVLQTGLYLTVAGMGLVFLVLAMLWGLITLLLKFDMEPLPPAHSEVMGLADSVTGGKMRPETVAAISVAIHADKTDKKRERVKDMSFGGAKEDVDSWSLTGRAQQQRDWQPRRWN